jgi:hypothetical protein
MRFQQLKTAENFFRISQKNEKVNLVLITVFNYIPKGCSY